MSAETEVVVRAVNMMGGMDWAALPIVVEIFGIQDIEKFIAQVKAIQEYQRARS